MAKAVITREVHYLASNARSGLKRVNAGDIVSIAGVNRPGHAQDGKSLITLVDGGSRYSSDSVEDLYEAWQDAVQAGSNADSVKIICPECGAVGLTVMCDSCDWNNGGRRGE